MKRRPGIIGAAFFICRHPGIYGAKGKRRTFQVPVSHSKSGILSFRKWKCGFSRADVTKALPESPMAANLPRIQYRVASPPIVCKSVIQPGTIS
ncbi:MAG: hypothetical protein VX878_09870, partial [Pseudomonadota bacterium]|nr:hypothetical protein [Pseudomonadota bacterium]